MGLHNARDGYVYLMLAGVAGAGFGGLVAWMRESGAAEDLDEEPYASLWPRIDRAFYNQVVTGAVDAGTLEQLAHVRAVVERFFAALPAREAYEEGQRRNLLVGLIASARDIAESPQLRARSWFTTFEGPGSETVEFIGPPYRLGATPALVGRPPRLGEHTREILAELRP
jgi:hypothetical protein